MKHFLFILLLFISTNLYSQTLPGNFNLVPNSSFEFNSSNIYTITDTDFINNNFCWIKANYWDPPIEVYVSSFIRANTGDHFGLITSGYGIYVISSQTWLDTSSEGRTYYQTKLSEPLTAGVTYYFTIYGGQVEFPYSNNPPTANIISNIGAYFSNNKLNDYTNEFRINVTPQIDFVNWNIPFTDTFMYVKLSATYTAAGGEQYLTIGNFDYSAQLHFLYISPYFLARDTAVLDAGYMYIDDISLVSDTTQPMISLSQFSLGNDTVLCPGQSLTIGGQPYFFHYWWNTGDTTQFITVTQPGTYWCTVDYGCSTYTDTINILSPIAPVFHLPDTAVCLNNGYTAYAPTGYQQYLWSTGAVSPSVAVTSPGLYWVQLTNCGSVYTDTFTVSNLNTPVNPFTLPNVYLCSASDSIHAPAPYPQYLWSTNDTSSAISISTPGIYWLRAGNDCGVYYTDTFRALFAVTAISLGNDTVLCGTAPSYTLSLPPGLSNIVWSTGDTTASLTITQPGTYSVSAQSPCGTFSDTVNVGFCSPAIDNLSISADTICTGQCINITALTHNYPQAYNWVFTGGSPNAYIGPTPPTVCYDSAGIYAIKLFISSPGGADSTQAQVVVMPQPQGSFADTLITVPYNTALTLQPCAPALHTKWYHNDTPVVTDNYQDGALSIIAQDYQSVYKCVVNNAGCTDTCAYSITVTDIPNGVWLPGAFSPNNDGKDDYFHIITANPNIEVVELAVYDRYGQRIYYTNHNDNGWDGTYKGVQAEIGTYFWYLRYKLTGSQTLYSKKGNVMLIR